MARTDSTEVDNTSIAKTAIGIQELVSIHKEGKKQTKLITAITIISAVFTSVTLIPTIFEIKEKLEYKRCIKESLEQYKKQANGVFEVEKLNKTAEMRRNDLWNIKL